MDAILSRLQCINKPCGEDNNGAFPLVAFARTTILIPSHPYQVNATHFKIGWVPVDDEIYGYP